MRYRSKQVRSALEAVSRARQELIHPSLEGLGEAQKSVESAVEVMKQWQAEGVPLDEGIRPDLLQLQREVRQVGELLSAAALYHKALAALWEIPAGAAYTPFGGAEAPGPTPRLLGEA